MDEKLYTIPETANILRIHKQTLYRMIKSGIIKELAITEGRKVISSDEIKRYIESRKAL
jgi:excisionase family DNA binding protein